MVDVEFEGFEPWTQCKHCDATFYGEDWHLMGYRSIFMPPCTTYIKGSKWERSAELVPTNFGESK